MSTEPLPTLTQYPTATYLTLGSVARAQHDIARVAGNVHSVAIQTLADAIHIQAKLTGRDGVLDYSRGVIVVFLLGAFRELLDHDTGGWDAGTCDRWAHEVAVFIGRDLDT